MFRRLIFVLPVYLAVAGVLFHYNSVEKQRIDANVVYAENQAVATIAPTKSQTPLEGTPIELYIPRLDLRLLILPGSYDPTTRQWVLSSEKAHFAAETQKLNNEAGFSLIYGHYNQKVFKPTDNLKQGDLIEITTDTNLVFAYRYSDAKILEPSDVSIFDYTGKPKLSLLTCSGTWFENRRIMDFYLVSVRRLS